VVLRFTPIINFTYTFVFSNCVWLQRLTTFSQREGHAQSTRATLEMEPARPAPVSTRGSTSASHEKLANLQFQATASDFLLADSESQVQSLALVVKDLQEQLVSSQDSASRLSKIQVHLARHFGDDYMKGMKTLLTRDHRRSANAPLQQDRAKQLEAAKKLTRQLEAKLSSIAADHRKLQSEVLASRKASLQLISLELQRDAARENAAVLVQTNSELDSKVAELEAVTVHQFLELRSLAAQMAELQGEHEGELLNLRAQLRDGGWTDAEASDCRTVNLVEVKHGRTYDVKKALEVARLCTDFGLHGRRINALIHRTLSIFTDLNEDTLQKLVPLMGKSQLYHNMDVLGELTHENNAVAFFHQRPWTLETDEGPIKRRKRQGSFLGVSDEATGVALIVHSGLRPIHSTSGADQLDHMVTEIMPRHGLALHTLVASSTDSASTNVGQRSDGKSTSFISRARDAKLIECRAMLAEGKATVPTNMPAEYAKDFICVAVDTPTGSIIRLLPTGVEVFYDCIHILKVGEDSQMIALGKGYVPGAFVMDGKQLIRAKYFKCTQMSFARLFQGEQI
jgi:hypothetical protein